MRWFNVEAVPEREPDGSVLWYGFTSDVTDVKRAQHALDRQRLHHLAPEFALDLREPRRRLVAVQLQDVGLQRFDDALECRIIGIDGQRRLDRALADLPTQFPRYIKREMTRRRGEEHEAYHVGARLQRRRERLGRRQAADFDEQGHDFGAWLSIQDYFRRVRRRSIGPDAAPAPAGAGSTTLRRACRGCRGRFR